MTGYGRSIVQRNNIELEIEIKSVNSRYLDTRIYLPRELGSFEYFVRQVISHYISRGTVEVRITFNDLRPATLHLNENKLLKYHELAVKAAELVKSDTQIAMEFLLNEPGVIENDNNLADDPDLHAIFNDALQVASKQAIASMENEGEQIKQILKDSIIKIQNNVDNIKPLVTPFREEMYQNMLTRVKELLSTSYLDNLEQRVAQEIAIYVDKYDIGEELTRLESHYQTFVKSLELDGDVGKTLNFIIQEMQREANTLGSKFSTTRSFPFVLQIKEEIEKCREIVQNVS